MSYSAGEALILTRLQACAGFSSANTSRANWKILNSGKDDNYGILRPGEFGVEMMAYDTNRANYTTVIEVWQRYTDDATTQTNLYTHINNVISGLMPYPQLGDTGGTILFGMITGAAEPEEMWNSGGGPQWLRWSLTLSWSEETPITYA